MVKYNTDLQTNNTNLQAILNKANSLPLKEYTEIQKWVFTLEDGTIVEKYVEFPKYIDIIYELEEGITSSNTTTKVKYGEIYRTIITAPEGDYLESISYGFMKGQTGAGVGYTVEDVHGKSLYELEINTSDIPSNLFKYITIEATSTNVGDEEW